MQPDSQTPSLNGNEATESIPPIFAPAQKPSSLRSLLSVLLSLCLGLFLADGIISLADDSYCLFFGNHPLSLIRGIVVIFSSLLVIVVYGLMGLTPMIPKRVFIPLAMFCLAAQLVVLPLMIYFYNRLSLAIWIISACQVIFGLGILIWLQGSLKLRWPLVAVDRLGTRCFGWLNLTIFLVLNVFLLLPAMVAYLVVCTVLAVGHFSDGFLALRPNGLTVQVRKYVRNDGKMIELVPMAHIGDAKFYQQLTQSFPTNAIILMEGVTDKNNLITNKISYKRMANKLGLAEQHEKFKPNPNQVVHADVDVDQFSTNTIDLLNLVMRIHAQGLNLGNLQALMQYPQPPGFEFQLFDDLLTKRNEHLLYEIRDHQINSKTLIVPWGAAHMPGIAREILKAGFRLDTTQEYTVIQFGGRKSQGSDAVVGKGH